MVDTPVRDDFVRVALYQGGPKDGDKSYVRLREIWAFITKSLKDDVDAGWPNPHRTLAGGVYVMGEAMPSLNEQHGVMLLPAFEYQWEGWLWE